MPIYEYKCNKCNEALEIMQGINDKPLTECAKCGGNMEKIMSGTSFVLKGTGWYKTDYANKGGSGDKKDSKPACASCPSNTACGS